MYSFNRIAVTLVAALCFALGGCEQSNPEDAGRSAAAVLSASNEGEIQLGQLVQVQGMGTDVKDFANKMVTDHTAAQQRQSMLFVKHGIFATENASSQGLRNDTKSMLDKLRTLSGAAFDKEYVNGQVRMHQKVLSILDGEVLPSMLNADLRVEVQNTRSEVAAHVQQALMLQTKLGGP